jgi:aryl-alcohol dehydrogenase-like predicted oxidoreductase
MERRRLGRSAIVVSDICMGTMTFGSQADEAEALRILDRCFEAGIDFYDTAEIYPIPPDAKWVGRTEDIVGKWLKTKPRDAVILATKVSGPSHIWFRSPKRSGMTALDRHHIRAAIEESLRRLGTDYVDLYQTHWPDPDHGYEETLEALDGLVREGKVRVLGCSNETTWGLMKAAASAEKLGTARFQTIQNNFSLNNRRFEDELADACRREGVSLIPFSPLAGGVLSGKYNGGARPEGARFSRYLGMEGRQRIMGERFVNDRSLASTERFMGIAQDAGLDPVTMAIAWSKQHDFVASTIVGVSSEDQLAAILAAADVKLDAETLAAIDEVSKDILYPMG